MTLHKTSADNEAFTGLIMQGWHILSADTIQIPPDVQMDHYTDHHIVENLYTTIQLHKPCHIA